MENNINMKKILGYLGIVGSLIAAFLFERNKLEDAEAQLANQKMKEKDAGLNQHTLDLQGQIESDKVELDNKQKETLTTDQLADALKNDLKDK